MTETTHDALLRQTRSVEELLEYFRGVRGDIDTRVQNVVNRHLDFQTIVHVDQNSGSNTNDGTSENPLATVRLRSSRCLMGVADRSEFGVITPHLNS